MSPFPVMRSNTASPNHIRSLEHQSLRGSDLQQAEQRCSCHGSNAEGKGWGGLRAPLFLERSLLRPPPTAATLQPLVGSIAATGSCAPPQEQIPPQHLPTHRLTLPPFHLPPPLPPDPDAPMISCSSSSGCVGRLLPTCVPLPFSWMAAGSAGPELAIIRAYLPPPRPT